MAVITLYQVDGGLYDIEIEREMGRKIYQLFAFSDLVKAYKVIIPAYYANCPEMKRAVGPALYGDHSKLVFDSNLDAIALITGEEYPDLTDFWTGSLYGSHILRPSLLVNFTYVVGS